MSSSSIESSSSTQMAAATQLITGLISAYERYMVAQTNFNIYKRRHYTMTRATRSILRHIWYRLHYNVPFTIDFTEAELEGQLEGMISNHGIRDRITLLDVTEATREGQLEGLITDQSLRDRLTLVSQSVKHLDYVATQIDRNQTTNLMQQGILELPPNINRLAFYDAYDFGSTECRLTHRQVAHQDIPVHLLPTHQVSRRTTQLRVRQQQQPIETPERRYSIPSVRPQAQLRPRPTVPPLSLPVPRLETYVSARVTGTNEPTTPPYPPPPYGEPTTPPYPPPPRRGPSVEEVMAQGYFVGTNGPSSPTYPPPAPPRVQMQPPRPLNLHQQHYINIAPRRPPIKVKYEQKLHTPVAHDDCAICYAQYKKFTKVTTNCEHAFCVTCVNKYITSYASSNHQHNPINCPMCRTNLTELRTHTKKNVFAIIENPGSNLEMEAENV